MRSADVRKFISQRVYNEQSESEPEQEPESESESESEQKPEPEPEQKQPKQSAEQIIIGGCRLTAPYI
jgi:hypothetical protein